VEGQALHKQFDKFLFSTRFSGVDYLSGCPYTDPAFTPRQDRATQRCDLSGCGGLARERFYRSFVVFLQDKMDGCGQIAPVENKSDKP